ncbi:helix-turn-helix transcriptional regulator [Roseibium sp. Sym1]|uniref:helix-turn-helix transcriptional regulator n=1 Tax=Roseibium sp. Sym1 TaxID=3016006 RepID=UPI0022B5936C|nr:helix-turn-helix transcriptional regulator [Roseibium sp. Sym1]
MKHYSALEIVGEIYEATLIPDQWNELLSRIASFCGGANAALVTIDPDINYSSVITPGANPESLAAYKKHWWRFDPISALAAKAPPGRFVSVADTDRNAYFASAFYNEFRRFTGYGNQGVTTTLFRDRNALSTFVLQTSPQKDEIDAQTLFRSRTVVPHLQRAVSIARKLHQLEFEQFLNGNSLRPDHAGLILVDAKRRCLYADDAAERLLATQSEMETRNGVLHVRDAKADNQLKSAILSCAGPGPERPCGDPIQVKRGHGQPALTIEVLPYQALTGNPYGVRAAAMLLLRDPCHGKVDEVDDLKNRFDLTPAEARLAIEMLKGDGREAAAGRCGISINTARTHLMRIFEKTGVKRQAELIRVLLES